MQEETRADNQRGGEDASASWGSSCYVTVCYGTDSAVFHVWERRIVFSK